jgi:DNA-binding IscR family transcriptional regulator
VASTAGTRGGYILARNPTAITIGAVVPHFAGILAPIAGVPVTGDERCSQESVCRFRRVFFKARKHVAGIMDRPTLADVAKGPLDSTGEMSDGFAGGEGI